MDRERAVRRNELIKHLLSFVDATNKKVGLERMCDHPPHPQQAEAALALADFLEKEGASKKAVDQLRKLYTNERGAGSWL